MPAHPVGAMRLTDSSERPVVSRKPSGDVCGLPSSCLSPSSLTTPVLSRPDSPHPVHRWPVDQQQQSNGLSDVQLSLGDNNNMLGKMFEELRLEVIQSRQEILNSLDQKARDHSLPSSTQNAGPGLEGANEQQRQQDLLQMKQTLSFIHKEILETRRETSTKFVGMEAHGQTFESSRLPNETGPNSQKGEQVASEGVRGDDGQNAKEKRLAVQVQQRRNQMIAEHGVPQLWAAFQDDAVSFDHQDAYHLKILEKRLKKQGFWHWFLRNVHLEHLLPEEKPHNALALATHHIIFTSLQTILILGNAVFMGYESDILIKGALEEPPAEPKQWLKTVELAFNLVFAAELLFRIIALRSWFWFSTHDWVWNLFDVFLVGFSLVSDLLATGANVSFIRLFRIMRAIRVVRVIRVLRFFRHLRQMLFAVLACLGSLAWSFVFFGMLMLMFSIVILQGITDNLTELDWTSERAQAMRNDASIWFGTLGKSMLSLLAAVTGGMDWLIIKEPLDDAGWLYGIAFIAYLLFITVGVMNVLTGIFLSNADEFFDLDLIGQSEQAQAEAFIVRMLQFFKEIDLNHSGEFDWPTFHEAMKHDNLKGFLTSMSLEPTHLRLIFDLLDERRTGKISMDHFLMAILKLKGEAKAVDCRVMLRELSMLPMLLHPEQWQAQIHKSNSM